MREGLADVISMHVVLTNQILLFHSEILGFRVASCELYMNTNNISLEGERWVGLID